MISYLGHESRAPKQNISRSGSRIVYVNGRQKYSDFLQLFDSCIYSVLHFTLLGYEETLMECYSFLLQ
jgi:hypothetical protein